MIIRDRPSIWKLFFVLRGSIVPKIAPQILGVLGLGVGVVLMSHSLPSLFTGLTAAPFALLGLALSIFLGFRNNASYDRWWEARRQWGQLVVDARSFSRQINSMLGSDKRAFGPDIRRINMLVVGFCHALRHHLRQTNPGADLASLLDNDLPYSLTDSSNPPDSLLRELGHEIAGLLRTGRISEVQYRILDERLTSFAAVQAACERIQNTPLPFAYGLLLHRTAYLYCLALPFGLAATLGWLTPVISAVIAYTLFGLDALSEELEEPFGTNPHNLALGAISRSIEINTRESIEDSQVPTPSIPKDYLLS